MRALLLAGLLWLAAAPPAPATPLDHSPWTALLERHVVEVRGGVATAVDYAGLRRDDGRLQAYLDSMSAVTTDAFSAWPREDRLAFLVNAYNAWTVQLIVAGDPGIRSIRELGSVFRSPWKRRFVPLLGELRTLDEIEHELIRGSADYRDPRVHFAVNCASVGCPALRREAYEGARLDAQLDDATRRFLADRTRNRVEQGVLRVSSIFSWYRGDFEQGWRGQTRLGGFLALYADALGLDAAARRALESGAMRVAFLPYDWQLNGTGAGPR